MSLSSSSFCFSFLFSDFIALYGFEWSNVDEDGEKENHWLQTHFSLLYFLFGSFLSYSFIVMQNTFRALFSSFFVELKDYKLCFIADLGILIQNKRFLFVWNLVSHHANYRGEVCCNFMFFVEKVFIDLRLIFVILASFHSTTWRENKSNRNLIRDDH